MHNITSSIQENIGLKRFNTFGIDANARYFIAIQSPEELAALLTDTPFRKIPKLVLGDGSNVLFTKNYDGLIIKNAIRGIQTVFENDDHVWLKVGSGENWHDFVMYCIERGYGGVENLSLIPGTVGAAPIQNIGAYGMELCDVFKTAEAMNLLDGSIQTFQQADCRFGYRDSVFKNEYKNQYAILSVVLRLDKKHRFHIEYGNIQETLESMQVKDLSIKAISDAIIHIRQSKLPNPKELGNAGSFFKNPLIPRAHFSELKKHFPDMPSFPSGDVDTIKIPAAWLIEQCGFKGKRFGDAGVHEKQALILVNYNACKGSAILELAERIQQSVHDKFSVQLTPEVNLI
ncbi:MAG TPA: UDP-N-acetylmuramate dehydrogenase [Gammaproteobacteria bacterium]|nr:UDP-N-acetylmuramate dehydrogenase [Gammaproteobacteria bacterium]